jgi:hypothetical protein
MGNTTTHTQYTTSNTSSAPHPSTPHNPNPTAPSNNSHAPNSSPPHEKPSPNSHAPNTPTPTTSPTATTDTSNATSTPTPPSSTCSAIPSTPSPQTTPTPSPLMAPPSRAQVPTSQAPTGHPTPQTPPSPAGCAKPNASRGQAGLTTTPTPAVCPSIGCLPSPPKPATPTPPRAVPKYRAGLPACSAYARGSTPQGAPSNGCCAWATDGAIPKRWASWSCRTRSAACAHAKTRAGATCRRVRLQVGGVGGCIATQCGRRKTSGSSARGGNGCRLWCGGVRCGCWCRWWVRVVGWDGASGCFFVIVVRGHRKRTKQGKSRALIKPLDQRFGLRLTGIPRKQRGVEQREVELLPVVAFCVIANADLSGQEPLHHAARGNHRAKEHHHEHHHEFRCAQRSVRTHPRHHAVHQHHYEKQRNDRWGQLHHPDLDGLRHQLGSGDNHRSRRAAHKSQQ